MMRGSQFAVGLGVSALVSLGATSFSSGCTRSPGVPRAGGPSEELGADCTDGQDNDADGVRDCAEASCAGIAACAGDGGWVRGDGSFGTQCEEIDFEADTAIAPVDIVWVIDNSGSMDRETVLVQDKINAFAASIGASGIDYHVVVITDPSIFGLDVPAPLGNDPERFRLVSYDVQSADGFTDPLAAFDLYGDFLRSEALTHFVVVSDDESGMSWDEFDLQMRARLGHDFVLHAIVSPPGSSHQECIPGFGCMTLTGCDGYGAAAANGEIYWHAATVSGGLRLSICEENWDALFAQLGASIAVPTPIPCQFEIPDGAGAEFDPFKVNVDYSPGDGSAAQRFPYRGTEAGPSCPPNGDDGWYYDDPTSPTQIRLCPSTCSKVERDDEGRVDIAFGCDTLILL
jgi:hypothetical protein